MASYRPKSLNELNNLYDKSMAAQTAIKNKGSAIADSDSNDRKGHYSLTDDFSAPKEKTAAQTASDELSDALNDFMKNFGESSQEGKDKAPVRQPLPITKVVKATAPQKPKNKNKPEHPVQKVNRSASAEADKTKKEKPALMRSEERSDLLDDYMKIMNDEDDDSSPIKSIVKKKKKSKKNKHQSSPIFDDNTQNPEEELSHEEADKTSAPISSEEAESAEPLQDEIDAFEAFFRNEDDRFSEVQQEEPEQAEEDVPEESEEYSEEAPKAAKPKKKKSIFAQVFLMIILLAVLVSAVAVGLMKVVVGVDTGNAFADNYYVFTADEDYEKVGINKGDLVITENKDLNENEPFAYADFQNGHICFALKGSSLFNDRLMAHGDGGIEFVKNDAVRGAVIKTIPQVGSAISVLMENFIIVISVLVAVALILILVIALAFRSKPNYDIESFEEEEEETAETEEEYEDDYEDCDSSDSGYEYDETDEGESFEEDYDDQETDNNSDLFSTID